MAIGVTSGSECRAGSLTFELETTRDVAYSMDADADPVRHKLDIHRPKDCKNFPVVFFVHGGGWVQGNKDHFGVYTLLARTLARNGIGMVCPNYRLSPRVKHPEHIRDVAKAFAWTQRNIGKYGGDSNEIFVAGHSAGGHLSALLATDESYLRAEGLSLKNIKGAMPISGVLIVPSMTLFDPVFGKDPVVRKQASPVSHAGKQSPPFLILYADKDLPACDRPGAEALCKALQDKQCQAQACEIAPRNHLSILLNAAKESDPVMRSMLSFIGSQVVVDRLAAGDCLSVVDEMGLSLARYAAAVSK